MLGTASARRANNKLSGSCRYMLRITHNARTPNSWMGFAQNANILSCLAEQHDGPTTEQTARIPVAFLPRVVSEGLQEGVVFKAAFFGTKGVAEFALCHVQDAFRLWCCKVVAKRVFTYQDLHLWHSK